MTVEMEGKFIVELPVRYQDTDTRLRASPTALLGIMQEAAILHSQTAGRGIDWLQERKLSWLIVQNRMTIFRRPGWQTRVRVLTWVSEIGRFLSRREFELVDQEERPLVLATTLWAFISTASRRVTRVPPEVSSAYRVLGQRALDVPFRQPAICRNPTWKNHFVIRRWDLDFHGHVNNLRYLDWIQETLPQDLQEHWTVRELSIRYQKEAGPDDTVLVHTTELPIETGKPRQFAHQVVLGGSGECIATAESHWAPGD